MLVCPLGFAEMWLRAKDRFSLYIGFGHWVIEIQNRGASCGD